MVRSALRHGWKWCLGVALAAGALLAVAALALQWWLPRLPEYHGAVEALLARELGLAVRIGRFEGAWDGFDPSVAIDGLALSDPADGHAVAGFRHARAVLDLPASLLAWRPVFAEIALDGAELRFERDAAGQLRLLPPGGAPVPLEHVLVWLGGLRVLTLGDGAVRIREPDGSETAFPGLSLELRPSGWAGRRLALALGPRLRAEIELDRFDPDPAGWRGQFRLRAEGVELARLPLEGAPSAGTLDAELSGDWQGWRLSALSGNAQLAGFVPAAPLPVAWFAAHPQLELVFDWKRDAAGWSAAAELTSPEGLAWQVEALRAGEPLSLELVGARIEDLLALAGPWVPEVARAPLAGLAPHGLLAEGRLELDSARPEGFALEARLDAAGWRPWQGIPGIGHLAGSLKLRADGGELALDAPGLRLTLPGLFRDALAFGAARGEARWRRGEAGLAVELGALELANADLEARIHGRVELPAGGEPRVDLGAEVPRLAVGAAPKYLPVGLIGADGVAWLDRALKAGHGEGGVVKLAGPLSAFPFDRGEGEFDVRVRVRDGVLDFAPGWPALTGLAAELHFRNRSLAISAGPGRLLDVALEAPVEVRLPDLEEPEVLVQGAVRADGTAVNRLLRETPLAGVLEGFAHVLEFGGSHRVALDLAIPTDGRRVRVRGSVGFDDARLDIRGWGTPLEHLRGELAFDGEGRLKAEGIALEFGGSSATLEAGADARGTTQLELHGRFTPQALLGSARAAELFGAKPPLSGRAEGTLSLALPAASRDGPLYRIGFDSGLEGVAAELPPPLGKAARERRMLRLALEAYPHGRARLSASYGMDARALLELSGFPEAPKLERGDLRLGKGEAQLPATPGLRLRAHVPRFALGADAAGGTLPAWLARAELEIDELAVADQRFAPVGAVLEPAEGGTRVTLDGPALRGTLRLPAAQLARTGSDRTVRLELHRLHLKRDDGEAEGGAGAALDPRALPPLRVVVDDLRLDGRPLGRLAFATAPAADGLAIQGLELHADGHDFAGEGDWLQTAAGPRSRLRFGLRSAALGQTLALFGYEAGLGRGPATVDAELAWAAPLPALEVVGLEGRLTLDVGEGQLLELEPGVGRFLGLFSFASLTRRLTLDFSDLFGQGLGFDRIRGSFAFAGGKADTRDLKLEAPSAEIRVSGEVDLVRREYDQTVTVTPRLGAALPIAGAIAGGPVGAAAALVLERLLKPGIDQISQTAYRITGPWNAPRIERLGVSSPPPRHEPEERVR